MGVILERSLLIAIRMSDLIGFDGFLNTTTPFDPKEHRVRYKTDQKYLDFSFDNTYKDTCDYPRFWDESGKRVLKGSDSTLDAISTFDELVGCYNSEFDQVSSCANEAAVALKKDGRGHGLTLEA